MAFDEGRPNTVYVDKTVGEQSLRDRVMADFEAKKKENQQAMIAAQAELDALTAQIAQKKADMATGFAKSISDADANLAVIQAQINQANKDLAAVEAEIMEKTEESRAIQTDFSVQTQALADREAALVKRAGDLAQAESDLNAKQVAFASDSAATTTDLDAREAEVSAREKEVSDKAAGIAQRDAAVSVREQQCANAETVLDQNMAALAAAQADLNIKLKDARATLTQADAVAAQATQNELDKADIATQAEVNRQDVVQIKVARIALENQQADLNERARTIQAAEQKIGG